MWPDHCQWTELDDPVTVVLEYIFLFFILCFTEKKKTTYRFGHEDEDILGERFLSYSYLLFYLMLISNPVHIHCGWAVVGLTKNNVSIFPAVIKHILNHVLKSITDHSEAIHLTVICLNLVCHFERYWEDFFCTNGHIGSVVSATTPSYSSHLLLLSFSSSSFPASVVLSPLIHTLSSPSLCIFFTLLTNLPSCLSVPCLSSPHLAFPSIACRFSVYLFFSNTSPAPTLSIN